jgi:uncharacterized protein YkwD
MSMLMGSILMQTLAVSLPVQTTATPALVETSLNSVESALVQETNATRARHGRPPLALDTSLLRSARRHAQWMTRNRSLRHTSAAVAENIAMGQSSSSEVIRDWMNSPGHRANILNSNYRRIGVAAYRGADGRIFWCQQFLR